MGLKEGNHPKKQGRKLYLAPKSSPFGTIPQVWLLQKKYWSTHKKNSFWIMRELSKNYPLTFFGVNQIWDRNCGGQTFGGKHF